MTKIEVYDRKTKEVVEVIDCGEYASERNVSRILAGLHHQMNLEAYGTRVVSNENEQPAGPSG